MTEEQCATAVYETTQAIKRAIGPERAVGMVLGCVIGEVMLSGGTKEQLDKLVTDSWNQFQAAQKAMKGG